MLALPPSRIGEAKARQLLAEAIVHVGRLLESSSEADSYEAAHEREGSHITPDGTAAVIRGDDLMAVLGALDDAAAWSEHTGQRHRSARYRRIARSLGDDR